MEKCRVWGFDFFFFFVILLTCSFKPSLIYREDFQFTLSLLDTTELSPCQGDK